MSKELLTKEKLNEPAEEAYKVLRTNLQFCGYDRKIKTLTITSCTPGEGKTTTSINLAISMAKSGVKVVLVDADLRKPMLLKNLRSSNTKGLTSYISGNAELDDIINNSSIENFYFITCGPKPPNPAELLSAKRFSQLIDELETRFDFVIFDTPPLGSVIDCAIIASQTDGTIIVIKSKSVSRNNVQRVKEQLEKVNAKILGVVLNKISRGDYKNHLGYYNYYSEKKYNIKKWFERKKNRGV
ncbi:MAG: CpsD/CapB family tyrosine-protein kinase [Clostridia bacterium]|nr:CpsD/CapB family tyrosine-protein kinase [Clostridia bacterium]